MLSLPPPWNATYYYDSINDVPLFFRGACVEIQEEDTTGISSFPEPAMYLVEYGTQITIQGDPPPTRAGYTFKGWTTTKGETVENNSYAPGNPLTVTNDLTLYAVWEKDLYRINYYTNTGAYVWDMPNNYESGTTGNVTIAGNVAPSPPKRDNFIFGGWTTVPGGRVADDTYKPGNTIYLNGTINLYAVWKDACYYCGGTGTGERCYGDLRLLDDFARIPCASCGQDVYAAMYQCWDCHKIIYSYTCNNRSGRFGYCNYRQGTEHYNTCRVCNGKGYIEY